MKKLFYFFAILMALYSLPSLAQGDPSPAVNMDKYITLTVQSGKDIRLNFKAAQANTPVRIVSGTNTQDITVGTGWYVQNKLENDNFSVKSDGTTMTIYGDITGFNCSENGENLTSLDVSKNPQLTELSCYGNQLTSLDVSKNPQLTELYCAYNPLTSLDVSKNPQLTSLSCRYNNLTSLDVSKNTQLATLDCHSNQLTSLDVSKNTQLATLDCDWNNLTSLDVSKNTQLATLDCHSNQLTSLDVSKNTQLATLDCGWNKLTSLDVSKNTQLTTLDCYDNELTSLDVSKNTQLATLYCSSNQLTSLDVSKNANMAELNCSSNQLTSLDVSKNTQLATLICGWNQLTSLDVSKNTQLTKLDCHDNKFTTESMNELYCSLPDRQGREKGIIYPLYKKNDANHAEIVAATSDNARKKNWKVKYAEWNVEELDVPSNGNYDCSNPNPTPNMSKYITLTVQSGKDIWLNFKAPQANTPVRIVSGSNTQNITVGTDWFVDYSYYNNNYTVTSDDTTMTIYGELDGFICSYNRENLTSLDLSNNSQLTRLDCYINQLTSLDVSNNTQLATLYCGWNQLTSLDVSKNTQLTELDCGWNQLTSLDVSKNTQLTKLDCYWNDLTSLDVSKNTQLTTLIFGGNDLTSLDVSKNTQLATLDCGGNDLTSLDVSKNTQLTKLDCYGNQLTSLDVSKNTQLDYLLCYDNQLTSLDVSKNTQLTKLDCYGNQLTSLDVSNNTRLTKLDCYGNQLTSLDVSKNTQLTSLRCYRNKFTTESMNELYCSLPEREEQNKGVISPVYKQDDANHAEIVAATSDNARAKNWEAKYGEWNIRELDVPSNGNYDCNSEVNENLSSGISVFPNPATSKVQIQLKESVNETLILVDLAGRAVLLEDVISGEATIDVSNLTAGTYFIRIGNITKKLTVK